MNARWFAVLVVSAMSAVVTAQTPAETPAQKEAVAAPERMYGYQLMSDAERAEYRMKMRALKTNEEREAFRLEHHKMMQERAKERGVTLPDTPPHPGMGQGRKQGPGMGGQQGPRPGPGGEPQPK